MHKDRNKDFKIMASSALGLLAISVFTSLFAAHHWFADLFSHFYIQYMVGGFLLAAWFGIFKQWRQMAMASFICVFSVFILATNFIIPPSHSNAAIKNAGKTFTVLHYNRNYGLKEHSALATYLRDKKPDIAVLQEATQSHVEMVEGLRDIYPHQIHEPRQNAFGMIVMSQHPFLEKRVQHFERIALDNFQIRFKVQPDELEAITVYAIHPPPPTSRLLNRQRNMELAITSKNIAQDKESKNIIMLGDWNITPFSPPFYDVLETTGLKHEHTSFPPFVTWPSQFALSIFQIPIDHILHKGDLDLISKTRGPALGSDHYPVLAKYTFICESCSYIEDM